MSGQTNERAFEVHVEEVLHQQGGWQSGTNAEWDVERALFPARVCAFLQARRPSFWPTPPTTTKATAAHCPRTAQSCISR